MCSNETHSKLRIVKHLSAAFPTQNGLKQGDALSPLLFNFALEYAFYLLLIHLEFISLYGLSYTL
jgi:hypothetical protein